MRGKFLIERFKLGACCTLVLAGLFALTSIALGTEAIVKNATELKSKPSGVLANAANAAAAAANAANAAANAANAASKAATAALEALKGIFQSPATPSEAIKAQPAQNPTDPAQNLPPQAADLLLAPPAKDLQSDLSTGTVKFVTPGEQSLVGLVGKFEIPVFADLSGDFIRNIVGNQILENEPAGEIGETNLKESIRAGRDFSRESMAANMRTEQAKAQTGQALAILLPSVSVRASSGIENSAPAVSIDPVTGKPGASDTHTRTDVALTVRQPLFDLPSFLDWRRRGVVEKSRNESYRVSDGDAYISSVNAYLSLVSSRLQSDMTRDFETQLNELLVYIEKRASAGAASVSDMARVRARSQGAMSSRLEQESAHAAAGVEFVRLTNLLPRTVRLPELADVGAQMLPKSLDVAVTTAMIYNPEIATLTAEVQAAKMDQSVAKSRYLPRVDAEYTDNYSLHAGGDPSSAGQRDKRLMMVLNWNLFSGGSDYKYQVERTARHTELKYRMDDQRRRVVQTLSANYATLATTRERLNAGYSELKSMSTAAEAMSKRMLSGNQSLLDLLDVYDRYYQARVRLVNLHVLEMSTVTQIVRLTTGTPGTAVALKSTPTSEAIPQNISTTSVAVETAPAVTLGKTVHDSPKGVATPPASDVTSPVPAVTPIPTVVGPSGFVPKDMPLPKPSEPLAPTGVPAETKGSSPPNVPVPGSAEKLSTESGAPLVPVTESENVDNVSLAKLREKAESGDAAAQKRMGWLYSSGTWVTLNKAEAVYWYNKAASHGDLDAQLALGLIYYAGERVAVNSIESGAYYRKVAGQGGSKAAAMLTKLEIDTVFAAPVDVSVRIDRR